MAVVCGRTGKLKAKRSSSTLCLQEQATLSNSNLTPFRPTDKLSPLPAALGSDAPGSRLHPLDHSSASAPVAVSSLSPCFVVLVEKKDKPTQFCGDWRPANQLKKVPKIIIIIITIMQRLQTSSLALVAFSLKLLLGHHAGNSDLKLPGWT